MFASNSDWFIAMFPFVVVVIGFGFTELERVFFFKKFRVCFGLALQRSVIG